MARGVSCRRPAAAGCAAFALEYFRSTAFGDDAFWPRRRTPPEEPPADSVLAARQDRARAACRAAVTAHLDVAMRFVGSPHDKVACQALALAAFFPELPRVRDALHGAADPQRPLRSAVALVARAHFGEDVSAEAEELLLRLEPKVRGDRPSEACVHAACASIVAAPEKASDRALAAVASSIGRFDAGASPFTLGLMTLAERCFALVPEQRRARFVARG